uniref:Uncharacterized protein n=1 Tax=Aegilops tauschii subsp. strangulata TaxID=200361 RepID=A0A453S1G7_AEGTS
FHLKTLPALFNLTPRKKLRCMYLGWIEDGEIHATINQKDGMVSFNEDPEQYKSSEMVEHIDSSIQRLMALSKKLTSIDQNISCDHAFLMKVQSGRERARFDYDDFDSVPHKYF